MGSMLSFDQLREAAQSRLAALDHADLMRSGIVRDPRDYYLLATYPPLRAMQPLVDGEVDYKLRKNGRIYVHIPFCEQYCTFCHYTKEINPKQPRVTRYLAALYREFEMMRDRTGGEHTIESIFFGGGTPSYLSAPQLDATLSNLKRAFALPDATEMVFELHPSITRHADFSDRLAVLADHGVDRWVFGVQSMDERVLRKLNRGHGRVEVFNLIEQLHQRGCSDLSADLIFGLPYQTLENWYETISSLVGAGIEKFNIFPLMFKPTDPIYRTYIKDPSIFPTAQERLVMAQMAEILLEQHGFALGPISYYSKGKHSYPALNQTSAVDGNIQGLELVPLGVSSFGWINGTQFFNDCTMSRYLETVEQGRLPAWYGSKLTQDEQMRRAIMVHLRSTGFRSDSFRECFGVEPASYFAREFAVLRQHGLIEESDGVVRLSARGLIDAPSIACLFASDSVRAAAAGNSDGGDGDEVFEAHSFSPLAHQGVSELVAE